MGTSFSRRSRLLSIFVVLGGAVGCSGGEVYSPDEGGDAMGAEGPDGPDGPDGTGEGNEPVRPGEGNEPSQPVGAETPDGEDLPGAGNQPTAPATVLDETDPQPLRRLSHVEYENTLRDLFPSLTFDLPTLPAEAKLDGFENNYSKQEPSALLVERYSAAATSIAEAISPAYVTQELAPCGETLECARTFIQDFGLLAFRRPLTDSEFEAFEQTFTSGPGSDDFVLGVRLTVMGMLQSASFLYRPEFGVDGEGAEDVELSPYEVASRLSYFVWGSMPDGELLDAAANGKLTDVDDVGAQAERLLEDSRARQGISQFFSEWLQLPRVSSVAKRAEDDWSQEFRDELAESAVRFVYDEVFASGGGALELLTSNAYPATPRIAELLGAESAGQQGWQVVTTNAEERAGFLTHPAFLGAYGYGDFPSPVLRGVFVMDRLLCAPPSPPPPGVNVTLPDAPEERTSEAATNREAYEQVTGVSPECAGCHSIINPLGFAFENYDTLGRYRTEDNGEVVDATGVSMGFDFSDGVDLAQQIAGSEAYRACAVKKMLTFGFGGGPAASSSAVQEQVLADFAAAEHSFKALVVAIARHERFSRWLAPPEGN